MSTIRNNEHVRSLYKLDWFPALAQCFGVLGTSQACRLFSLLKTSFCTVMQSAILKYYQTADRQKMWTKKWNEILQWIKIQFSCAKFSSQQWLRAMLLNILWHWQYRQKGKLPKIANFYQLEHLLKEQTWKEWSIVYAAEHSFVRENSLHPKKTADCDCWYAAQHDVMESYQKLK